MLVTDHLQAKDDIVNAAGQPTYLKGIKSHTSNGIYKTREDLLKALEIAFEFWKGAWKVDFSIVVGLVCEHVGTIIFGVSRILVKGTGADSHVRELSFRVVYLKERGLACYYRLPGMADLLYKSFRCSF